MYLHLNSLFWWHFMLRRYLAYIWKLVVVSQSWFVYTIICMFVRPRYIITIIVLTVVGFYFDVSLVYFVIVVLTVTYYECDRLHKSAKNTLEVRIRKREGAQRNDCGHVPPARGMSKVQNSRADHQHDDDTISNHTQNGILENLMGRGLTSTPLRPTPRNQSVFFSPGRTSRTSGGVRYCNNIFRGYYK